MSDEPDDLEDDPEAEQQFNEAVAELHGERGPPANAMEAFFAQMDPLVMKRAQERFDRVQAFEYAMVVCGYAVFAPAVNNNKQLLLEGHKTLAMADYEDVQELLCSSQDILDFLQGAHRFDEPPERTENSARAAVNAGKKRRTPPTPEGDQPEEQPTRH